MKTKNKIALVAFVLLLANSGRSQDQSQGNAFSLQQAIEYAMKNSPSAINANNDIIAAKYRKREIAGIGYPQLSASFSVQDFIKIPVMVIPNFVSPAVYSGLVAANAAPPDDKLMSPEGYDPMAAQFGMKYQAAATASLTQIVFSSDYIVALQAAKYLELMATISANRSKADVIEGVSKSYYSVLVSAARLAVLTSNIDRLSSSMKEIQAMNQQGLVELIDVERLEVAYNNLVTEKQNLEKLLGLSEVTLRFQMGYVSEQPLILTDSLPSDLQEQEINLGKSDYSNRPEFQLLKSTYELQTLNLRKEKLGYLPTIAAFASGGYNGFGQKFDLFSKQGQWFPQLIIGGAISLNIFDGLQRHNRIQQVKLEITKSQQNLNLIQQSVNLETSSAVIAFNNSLASLKSQTRNRDLAKHVQEVAQKKYQEGVGSNLEVVTAETELRAAEANYFNAVYNALVAKIDYQKAIGALK